MAQLDTLLCYRSPLKLEFCLDHHVYAIGGCQMLSKGHLFRSPSTRVVWRPLTCIWFNASGARIRPDGTLVGGYINGRALPTLNFCQQEPAMKRKGSVFSRRGACKRNLRGA